MIDLVKDSRSSSSSAVIVATTPYEPPKEMQVMYKNANNRTLIDAF